MKVLELPSMITEEIDFTLPIFATAASTWRVI